MARGTRRNEPDRLRRNDRCGDRHRPRQAMKCRARNTHSSAEAPDVARTRARAKGTPLQSCLASAARAGAKSSTTVTVATGLPRRGSSMRSIASPPAVRAVIPWRVTAPLRSCSRVSSLPPSDRRSIIEWVPLRADLADYIDSGRRRPNSARCTFVAPRPPRGARAQRQDRARQLRRTTTRGRQQNGAREAGLRPSRFRSALWGPVLQRRHPHRYGLRQMRSAANASGSRFGRSGFGMASPVGHCAAKRAASAGLLSNPCSCDRRYCRAASSAWPRHAESHASRQIR